ncbi:hypothetical protein FGO68_gene1416 [Halteria grandinella]|uniref:Uncharacterized protein n=1 Tax=Halteria grandinella TaxID=5974 RepID=A0A8J8NHI2_HALGN|nr:hypothetical protein FGO68_gene1416 [Halteria grandinella]
MLPNLQKERSNSFNVRKQTERNINADVTPLGEGRGSLIVLIMKNEEFIADLIQNPRYLQFLKYKEFLSELQVKQFIAYLQEQLIGQISKSYTFHYCTFSQQQKKIDLMYASSREIYEVLFEFSERMVQGRQFNYIFGIDFNLIHKSKFKQIFYMSDARIDQQIVDFFHPTKIPRLRSLSHQSPPVNDQTEVQDSENKFQQIASIKRNKEIKQYFKEQNKLKMQTKAKDQLMIKKIMQTEKIEVSKPQTELPHICEQVLQKFQLIFGIRELEIDLELFSQFLLLCEMTILYTQNKLLQVQIHKIEVNKRLDILLKQLYFDYKILKSMNSKLQSLNPTSTKCLLRFLKQGLEYDRQNRLFWQDFLRFKIYYIDKQWSISDFRLFLMLMNDENSAATQKLLKVQQNNVQRTILLLEEEQLQEIVYSLIF